jgi:hypothetical protein
MTDVSAGFRNADRIANRTSWNMACPCPRCEARLTDSRGGGKRCAVGIFTNLTASGQARRPERWDRVRSWNGVVPVPDSYTSEAFRPFTRCQGASSGHASRGWASESAWPSHLQSPAIPVTNRRSQSTCSHRHERSTEPTVTSGANVMPSQTEATPFPWPLSRGERR